MSPGARRHATGRGGEPPARPRGPALRAALIDATASIIGGASGGDGTVSIVDRSGHGLTGLPRPNRRGEAPANAAAGRIAATAGIPAGGDTNSATSRGRAHPAQRPSRPERPRVATLASCEFAPQSGQSVAIGKRARNIEDAEHKPSPLRIREPRRSQTQFPAAPAFAQRGLRCPHGFVYGSVRVWLDRTGCANRRRHGYGVTATHGPAGPKRYDRSA